MNSKLSIPKILIYDQLNSTNLEALRISETITNPCWLLAYQQNKGIGRYGRRWVSTWGNFSASLIYFPTGSLIEFSQRSFCTALAVRDTLINFGIDADKVTLKWPNDILVNNKKIAGILLQATNALLNRKALVVGIGVNIIRPKSNIACEEMELDLSSMSDFIDPPNPRKFLEKLIQYFDFWENRFNTQGFADIKYSWEKYGPSMGQSIKIRCGKNITAGSYLGLNELGELIANVDGDLKQFSSAEIFF